MTGRTLISIGLDALALFALKSRKVGRGLALLAASLVLAP